MNEDLWLVNTADDMMKAVIYYSTGNEDEVEFSEILKQELIEYLTAIINIFLVDQQTSPDQRNRV